MDKNTEILKKLYTSNTFIQKELCCLKNAISTTPPIDTDCTAPTTAKICNTTEIVDPIVKAIKDKKDYEPLVLCDVVTGLPVIIEYTFDDTGRLSIIPYNIDGTLFTGTYGKCSYKTYGVSSKEWFCITGTQKNITREDIINFEDNSTVTSIWRDELGTIVAAPTTGTFTIGVCTLPVKCVPTISDAFADDLSTLLPGTNFVITKPDCCKIKVITSVGEFTLREKETYYSTTDFNCPISITEITKESGSCDLTDVHIISNNKG